MRLFEIIMQERRYGDWAILPATMALYNKRTVDLVTAASEWKNSSTTILICSKTERTSAASTKERICFISSAGDSFEHYKKNIGNSYEAYHDQTMQSKGLYKIVNVVVLKDGEIIKKANDTGLNVKASLSVFK